MSIPISEMIADLKYTQGDCERLEAIVSNLESFIYLSGGEDRSFLKIDLLKYRQLLRDAYDLRDVINKAITGPKPTPKGDL